MEKENRRIGGAEMTEEELFERIYAGVRSAIEEMGIEEFEKCSFFISNTRQLYGDTHE